MKQTWKPNKRTLNRPLLHLLRRDKSRVILTASEEEKNTWKAFATYCVVFYVISFRGNKGLYLNLQSINEHNNRDSDHYFIIGLLGKIKGDTNH